MVGKPFVISKSTAEICTTENLFDPGAAHLFGPTVSMLVYPVGKTSIFTQVLITIPSM